MVITQETKCREGFDHNINMLPIITPLLLHLASAQKKKKKKPTFSTLNIMSKFNFSLPPFEEKMSMRRVAASFLFLSFLCVEGAEQHKSFLIFSAVRAARRYFNIFMILFFFLNSGERLRVRVGVGSHGRSWGCRHDTQRN